MRRVFSVLEEPHEIEHVAVAVHPKGMHIGILHRRNSSNDLRLLHLAHHLRLIDDPADERYFFVLPNVGRLGKQIAAFCRLVIARNPSLPYGFSQPVGAFTQAGKFAAGTDMVGLTCASFVLAIFDKIGVALVQYDTWQTRKDDEEWRTWIIEEIRRHAATKDNIQEHIDAITPDEPTVRYRPLEVAGSAADEDIPVRFCKALILAHRLASRIGLNTGRESLQAAFTS